ncbi:MAG: hypothetical protein IID53_07335 [Proteobacteria bacterium]|nr:hypothetical protein [Pseudomonadota bacterium]
MDPANREIFGALIRLATRLSPTQIIRGANAAGLLHDAERRDTADGINDLRIAFDKENSLDEQKARRSLCLLAQQWMLDVGVDRVQTTLGVSGLEFVDNEFRRLGSQPSVSASGLPGVTLKTSAEPDRDNTHHKTLPAHATVYARVDARVIRANRFAASGAVPVEQVQAEHATSLASLTRLRDTLGGLHGSDAAGEEERNTQESPLTETELSDLRSVVKSAIELHQVSSFSERIVDAHKALLNVLDGINEIIQKMAETVESLGDLGKQIGNAAKSWAVLIVAVAAFFI